MRIGVVGGGLMGSGIAEVCARAGVDVTVVEADDGAAERARARIEKSLDRGVRSGKLSADDREAAAERQSVWLGYSDADGGVQRLLFYPDRIEGGRVHGVVDGSSRTLSIHRVTGAAPG